MKAQLLDFQTHPNGQRYTAADKGSAYVAWRLNGRRSIRKAAEITGISASTIGNWHQDEGWRERADKEEDDEAKLVRKGIQQCVTADLDKAYEIHREIMLNNQNSARDRMDAAKWIAGLGGMAPVIKSESAFTSQPSTEADQSRPDVRSLVAMSPDELMRLEDEARAKKRPA
jgi:hypothetical protein